MTEKPRIRVKARRTSTIRVGGVMVAVEGYVAYGREFRRQLAKIRQRAQVFSILGPIKSGDYDQFVVIHD